ncbi:MAG: NFACT family protein [Thermoplasmata archaeon]|nr:NFACT family protein [Thermoplasmata archaeon]
MATEGAAAPPAKDRFSSLDTLALVRELRRYVGARLDKAFDLAPDGFGLTLRHSTAGRRELRITPGRFAALVERGGEHAEELTPVAKELRRLLSGARLTEVPDPGGERYLALQFSRPDAEGALLLGCELFGVGNLVVSRGGTIVAVQHVKRWAHRTVKVGAPYQPPPSRGDPWALTVSQLDVALRQSRTDRASTLAARLAFGGPIAEELLSRAELAGNVPASTDAAEAAASLVAAIGGLLGEVGEAPAGYLYTNDGVLVDVEPFPSRRWRSVSGTAESSRTTFSEAALEYFSSLPPVVALAPSPADQARGELERQHLQQMAAVAALTAQADDLRAQADALLAHYTEVEERIGRLAADASAGDVEIAGRSIPVRPGRPVRESANALYEEAKRLQTKLTGARTALRETEARLAKDLATHQSRQHAALLQETLPARKHKAHWFERYRWFLSSEGVIVIGGRDAATNDLIVRRYLNPADIYLHADIHGASSVVVKHPPPGSPPITEVTLREAAQWGVAFSKAWRAGLASGAAFWVNPDQVSKAGASGEFVARGAWVIHGTKNYFRDLPTELALGTIVLEGETVWSVAPPSAIAARGQIQRLLAPGEERDRAEVEISLSRELGVSRERLQSLLPAGGITVRRV